MFNFTAFLRKKWAEYSASSGQRGTVIDELGVKPAGLILADFYNSLVAQRRVNDILNWESMTDEELAFFGNKFFIPKILGDYSFGSVRVWFDNKKDIEITTETRAVSNTNYQYRAIQPGHISRNSFKISSEQFALYYVDIPIIATSAGNAYNVDAGEISQLININFTYKAISNPEAIANGSYAETNEQYYTRLLYGLNDRSLMNARSVHVRMPEFFPSINSIFIAGAGNRYMRRDLISGIDLSKPIKRSDFLGKTNGDNIVKHVGFFGFFPPNPGGQYSEIWGPHSIETSYKYPLTIDPATETFTAEEDPAAFGFPMEQECLNEMYRGMYFDDYKNHMEVVTTDLFNINDEEVGLTPVVIPNNDWMYGAHGRGKGSFGALEDGIDEIDVMSFSNNLIILAGGAKESLSVSKDILKRTGVKVTGTFIWPGVDDDEDLTANSNLQIMVGGINDDFVDGYTGVGFGVRVTKEFDADDIDKVNAVVYIAHSEKYVLAQIYATDADLSDHISVSDIGALAEKEWRVEPGVEYEFEFILHDDLRVNLFLYKTTERQVSDLDHKENDLSFQLPSKVLHIFSDPNKGGLLAVESERYGTMLKTTLDTASLDPSDQWQVSDLKAFNMAPTRAMAMYSVEVSDLEDPIRLFLRAFGNSAVQNAAADGFQAYIWDLERQSVISGTTELTKGAWAELEGLTNADGSKDALASILTHDIQNLSRYRVSSQYGKSIFLLLTSTGTSLANSRYAGSIQDDVQAVLRVDYMKVESLDITAFHARNKADIYVTTLKNAEELESTSTVLTKNVNDSFFVMSEDTGCKMPVAEIISVTIGTAVIETETLAETDYTVVQADPLRVGSSKEELRVILDEYDADTITVEYRTYPQIANIQSFFDSSQFEKIYGDILTRHQLPCDLTFTVYYTGNVNEDQLVDEIRKYVDDNIDGTFSVRNLVNYLYEQELVNNVQEPIEISYTKWNDEGVQESGTFTDMHELRPVDFFRVLDFTVSKL